jgi:hypothetical protein
MCTDISQCGPGETIESIFPRTLASPWPLTPWTPTASTGNYPSGDFAIPSVGKICAHRLLSQFPEEAGPINCYCNTIQQLHQAMHQLNQEMRWYDRRWSDWLKLPKYWNSVRKTPLDPAGPLPALRPIPPVTGDPGRPKW